MNKVALLTGGPGFERNVALKSVKLFEKYLKREFETFILPEDLEKFIKRKNEFDVAIPVIHGEYGEDGRLQALLDVYNIPFIGSSYSTNALCINKQQANAVAAYNGLTVPKELCISIHTKILEKDFNLSFPVIIKPNTGGSSYYTYKISDFLELTKKIDYIWEHIGDDLLIQEYIQGDEYSVSVVNGEILSPIMFVEKNNAEDFFDYESKYENDSGMRETFPDLDDGLRDDLMLATKKTIDIFQVKGYARVDFIVRDNMPYFLEVNTIPGSTEVSILPKAWKLTGRSMEEFVAALLTGL